MSKWKVYPGWDYVASREMWIARHATKAWLNEFFPTQRAAIDWVYENGAKFE